MTTPNINRILSRPEYRRNCSRGAPGGRTNLFNPEYSRLHVQRVQFIDGDYSADGTYWGGGEPLYAGFHEVNGIFGSLVFTRAKSRDEALANIQAEFPEATFYRSSQPVEWASFNLFELSMPVDMAESCSHSGDCDSDVAVALTLPHIRQQLDALPDAKLIAELKEYGAWDEEELKDRAANEARIVWLAAGNIVEDMRSK